MTDSLRILLVTADKYPPLRPAARLIFSDELPRMGHVIDWVIQSEGPCRKLTIEAVGDGTVYIGPTDTASGKFSRMRKHLLSMAHDLRVLRLMRAQHYDLVQVKDKYFGGLVALIGARMSRTPYAYWLAYPHPEASLYSVSEGTARFPWLNRIRAWLLGTLLYRVLLPGSDFVFVQSAQMKRDLAAKGVPVDKMLPVPSSVPEALMQYEPVAMRVKPEGQKWVVYLGTLIRVRKLDFVVRAFQYVKEEWPDARLLLVGKGEQAQDEERILEEAERLGLTADIEVTGQLPMTEAWSLVAQADVCLSPYYPIEILMSTSPTKLVEYMALGRPVVANDHPEQREVIEQSGGGFCTPWREEAFGRAIADILRHPEMGEEMGRKGKAYVHRHRTSRVIADEVEKVYLRLLRKSILPSPDIDG